LKKASRRHQRLFQRNGKSDSCRIYVRYPKCRFSNRKSFGKPEYSRPFGQSENARIYGIKAVWTIEPFGQTISHTPEGDISQSEIESDAIKVDFRKISGNADFRTIYH
jgi:hypothetical protein